MKSDINQIFARNMRLRRKELKLSQEKLGELSGLHRTYIGGIEQFLRNPSLASMKKIADALHIDVSLLTNKNYSEIVNSDYSICHFKDGNYSFKSINVEDIDPKILNSIGI